MVTFFIDGNVPSSKNKMRRSRNGGLFYDKTCKKYFEKSETQWEMYSETFRNAYDQCQKPVRIMFKFVRDSRRKFDYINPAQTAQDLMVKYGWIDDDNCTCIVPVFDTYEHNPKKPGVEITLIPGIMEE